MASKITFSNIKHTIVRDSCEITQTEIKGGKLNARSIVNRLNSGLKIDVLVLKNMPVLVCDEPLTFYENEIRDGTRRSFESLSNAYINAGKLPVHTDFFKKIEEGDMIIIILHDV